MIGAGKEKARDFGIRILAFLLLFPAALARAAEEAGAVFTRQATKLSLGRQAGLFPEVRTAIRLAYALLEDPRCAQIFEDFRDPSGNTLQQRLDSLGETGQTYLGGLLFYDGRDRGPCGLSSTLAWTTPGHCVIFFCRQAFASRARHDRSMLAVAILHEELHSLGLGENPPPSQEISRRIAERCR
jgi:hypothetical protein